MVKKKLILLVTFLTIFSICNGFVNASIIKTVDNNKPINPLVEGIPDLPEWSIGDFWEYNITLRIGGIITLDAKRVTVLITEETTDKYTVELDGYLDKALVEVNNYDYTVFMPIYLDGYAHIDRTTLAMEDYSFALIGNGYFGPFIIELDISLNMKFHSDLDMFNFPISVGKQWNIGNKIDFTINGFFKQSGDELFTINEESNDNPLNDELSVIKNQNIQVDAGEFDSYLISGGLGDPSELWYSPEVGYLVKVNQFLPGVLKIYIPVGFGSIIDLISTNFNHPSGDAPEIPQITGPSKGRPNGEYYFKIATNDPNGEQVYYKIDWGDGTTSKWIGPYNSGEEAEASHIWIKRGFFKVRVKAKDINGYETRWSDIHQITMPKSNSKTFQIYNFLFRFLDQIFLLKSILQKIIQF